MESVVYVQEATGNLPLKQPKLGNETANEIAKGHNLRNIVLMLNLVLKWAVHWATISLSLHWLNWLLLLARPFMCWISRGRICTTFYAPPSQSTMTKNAFHLQMVLASHKTTSNNWKQPRCHSECAEDVYNKKWWKGAHFGRDKADSTHHNFLWTDRF